MRENEGVVVVESQNSGMMMATMAPDILIERGFYEDHAALFDQLMSSVSWDDRMAARRTASFGKPYNYSQIDYSAAPIPDFLLPLVGQLHGRLGVQFNNCLLNYYQTGDNTMGFHSDDTSGLIAGTGVAIVSLGSVRDITYRSKANAEIQKSYALQPGSLLYMDELVQQHWVHAIKRQKDAGPRISLTWRAFR
jgi:alkylated DNA repair dioxygenase AlkB